MSGKPPEQRLSEFVTTLDYADLPDGVVDTVTRAFVDTVGVMLAGAVHGAGETVARTAGIDTGAADAATLLGARTDEPPAETALRLGTAGHALDYDDQSWALDGHPSVTLVPPLLALAGETEADGRDLVAAYAAGFEVEAAVAGPINPTHYETGWHATSTCGVFGATAAAAHLLDLDAATTRRALNVAASTSSGLKRNFGSMTKPLHAGLCARSGVTAALLARDGLTADDRAISGERGFWDLYGPDERGAFSVGDSFALETEGIETKAYPCCYFTHTAIAATQELVAGGIDPDDVERIEVRASAGAADALPHSDPETGLEAKFSMEHAVACAAVRDRVDLAAFDEAAVDDPTVARLRELVNFAVDDSLEYTSHEATVRMTTGAATHERRQLDPPGTHDNPLTEDELREKFAECAAHALPADEHAGLYDELRSLEAVSDFTAVLSGTPRP